MHCSSKQLCPSLQHSDQGHHDEHDEGGRHDETGAGVVVPQHAGVPGDGEAGEGDEADLEVDGRESQADTAVLGRRHRSRGQTNGLALVTVPVPVV